MINSEDQRFFREQISRLLPDSCHILQPTIVPDGQGGFTETWGTVYASLPCRLDPVQSGRSEQIAGAAVQPFDTWILTIPYDSEIEEDYRVVCNSETFSIESIDPAKSWKVSVRAVLKKL